MGNHVTYRMAASTPGQRDRWVKKLKEALAKRVLSAVSTKKSSPDSMSSSLGPSGACASYNTIQNLSTLFLRFETEHYTSYFLQGGNAAHQLAAHSKLKWRTNIVPVPEPGLTEEALVDEILTRLNSRRFATHPAEFLEYRDPSINNLMFS